MKFPARGALVAIEEGRELQLLFDADGLIPCITQDAHSQEVLMLGWMNAEALTRTMETGYAHYFSRARQMLWRKGEQSGQAQIVKRILIDDDQDCLLIQVELTGGASCHVGHRSCFLREVDWQTDMATATPKHECRQCVASPPAPRPSPPAPLPHPLPLPLSPRERGASCERGASSVAGATFTLTGAAGFSLKYLETAKVYDPGSVYGMAGAPGVDQVAAG